MYSVLIIDDEKRALNVLRILVEKHLSGIAVVDTALGAEEGLSKFQVLNPDLIFLDVEMPGMTGFELLEEIRQNHTATNVIFTTAYDHYAIRAIRFSAIDYLLKPIDVHELKSAYQRFLDYREGQFRNPDELMSNLMSNLKSMHVQKPRLAVPTLGGAVFFDIDEIVRCQADDNYTEFYLADGQRFVASKPLKEYDALLHDYKFLRVHQSHLVAPVYIKQYTNKGMLELKDGTCIPVSRRKHHWLIGKLREMYSGK
jgi:two-component system, LytTR family, response regulator